MPAESVLDTPLEEVLSGRLPARLASELSLTTVGELLEHTPRRWVERGELTLEQLDEKLDLLSMTHPS